MPWLIVALAVFAAFVETGRRVGNSSASRNEADRARQILGVSPTASRSEIEAAFRRLMLEAHPDRGGSSRWAAQLNAARDVLLGRG